MRVQVDPDKTAARSRSASTRSIRRCKTGTSTCRPASCSDRQQTFNIKAAGQLNNADTVPADHHHVPPGQRRFVWSRSPTCSTAWRTRRNISWFYTREGGQRAINMQVQRQPGDEHDRGDGRRPPRCCRSSTSQLPPSVHLRGARRSLQDHSGGVSRHPVDAAHHAHPGCHGDLPVPSQRIGNPHPCTGAAVLDPRHLRRHAAAELQPQQPLDDGADPLDRVSSWTTPS